MPINFPNTPSVGQQFSVNGNAWTWNGTSWDAAVTTVFPGKFIASTTPPEDIQEGQGWFDSNTGQFFIYYDSSWVEVGEVRTGPAGSTGPAGPAGDDGVFAGLEFSGKGEIVVGSGAGSAIILEPGDNNKILVANSSAPSGLQWVENQGIRTGKSIAMAIVFGG
jgi:hypothetical protein